MTKPSLLLTRAGSALIALGLLVLIGAALAPEAAPRLTITYTLPDIPTPVPAYLGTPLPPPDVRPGPTGVALVLPVMPVAETTDTPTPLFAAPDDPRDEIGAAAWAYVTGTPIPTITATADASVTPTRRPSITPMPSATPRPSTTPPPTDNANPAGSSPVVPTPPPPPYPPDRIAIPGLDVDAPVNVVGWHTIELEGATYGQWDVPVGYTAGWHEGSAPLGVSGNTVLNGHHNVEGEIFGRLIELNPGDRLTLYSGETAFRYVVAQTMVLQESWQSPEQRLTNARWILPSDDERVTLVTCWPHSHRLIVVAVPESTNREREP